VTPRRDFVDVRDAVRAYVLLAETGTSGEVYNVCGGRSYSVQECLDIVRHLAKVPLQVVSDPTRFRRAEIAEQVGRRDRLEKLGWRPEIPMEQSLADLLDDWRTRIREMRGS
jgi:GDP-4-dehydro-6-deoxy-D-mannose reductase